jgi:hypothetical protein
MAEENTGQESGKRFVMGKEKPDPETGEVGGRSRQLLIACFNDGAGNYWNGSWNGFTCWKCGARNTV